MLNVGNEVAALSRMAVKDLRIRYAEVFGDETKTANKQWLVKRIAWRLQALEEGDLSERARRRAEELANDADLRLAPPKAKPAPVPAARTNGDQRLPLPGTVITREYKGATLQVRVLPTGFEYEGEVYKSLSSVSVGDVGGELLDVGARQEHQNGVEKARHCCSEGIQNRRERWNRITVHRRAPAESLAIIEACQMGVEDRAVNRRVSGSSPARGAFFFASN